MRRGFGGRPGMGYDGGYGERMGRGFGGGYGGGPGRGGVGMEGGRGGGLGGGIGGGLGAGNPLAMVKKVMQQDVLYLMIVNLPTEDEIIQARERMSQGVA